MTAGSDLMFPGYNAETCQLEDVKETKFAATSRVSRRLSEELFVASLLTEPRVGPVVPAPQGGTTASGISRGL